MRHVAVMAAGAALAMVGCNGDRQTLAGAAKACHHDAEISCPRPILNVHDMRASQRYYRDTLGFKVDWEYGDPPDFASVSRGDGVIFLCRGCQGTPGSWVMMFARDVDRLYQEFRKRKALIRMPPTNMPWGTREMHVSDPDGNVMRFGTGIDDDD